MESKNFPGAELTIERKIICGAANLTREVEIREQRGGEWTVVYINEFDEEKIACEDIPGSDIAQEVGKKLAQANL